MDWINVRYVFIRRFLGRQAVKICVKLTNEISFGKVYSMNAETFANHQGLNYCTCQPEIVIQNEHFFFVGSFSPKLMHHKFISERSPFDIHHQHKNEKGTKTRIIFLLFSISIFRCSQCERLIAFKNQNTDNVNAIRIRPSGEKEEETDE